MIKESVNKIKDKKLRGLAHRSFCIKHPDEKAYYASRDAMNNYATNLLAMDDARYRALVLIQLQTKESDKPPHLVVEVNDTVSGPNLKPSMELKERMAILSKRTGMPVIFG